jgi:hypothetical protein
MDHYEVRGWRCIHRHYYLAGLSYLFCSRLRKDWIGTTRVDSQSNRSAAR